MSTYAVIVTIPPHSSPGTSLTGAMPLFATARTCAFATAGVARAWQVADRLPHTHRATWCSAAPPSSTPTPASWPLRPPPVHPRRAVLHAAALSVLGVLAHAVPVDASDIPTADDGVAPRVPAPARARADAEPGGDEQHELAERAAAQPAVSLAAFYAMVDRGDVSRVWFFGTTNETCLFATGLDGEIRKVGEGYPVETSGSPESPLAVVAYVRDR
jgi:hypothetical protein